MVASSFAVRHNPDPGVDISPIICMIRGIRLVVNPLVMSESYRYPSSYG